MEEAHRTHKEVTVGWLALVQDQWARWRARRQVAAAMAREAARRDLEGASYPVKRRVLKSC